jgi:hypothetical protein
VFSLFGDEQSQRFMMRAVLWQLCASVTDQQFAFTGFAQLKM